VIVKVRQSGLQLAVPSWMLDATFCQQLVDECRPRVAVSALMELGDLLDNQPRLASAPESEHQQRRRVNPRR
jgi:hypothetical protein